MPTSKTNPKEATAEKQKHTGALHSPPGGMAHAGPAPDCQGARVSAIVADVIRFSFAIGIASHRSRRTLTVELVIMGVFLGPGSIISKRTASSLFFLFVFSIRSSSRPPGPGKKQSDPKAGPGSEAMQCPARR